MKYQKQVNKINYKLLNEITFVETAHGGCLKQVFMNNESLMNKVTQIAFGVLKPGETCDLHNHPTMYEYFYFINGYGIYIIGDKKIRLQPGIFLEIPPKINHKLISNGTGDLEFVYWGVAI